MAEERNWAEYEKHIQESPTIEECYGTGHTHFHYGWSRTPWGNWTEEQKEAYYKGFDAAKQGK